MVSTELLRLRAGLAVFSDCSVHKTIHDSTEIGFRGDESRCTDQAQRRVRVILLLCCAGVSSRNPCRVGQNAKQKG